MARDGCRLQVGLPDPVATELEVPRSATAAGKAAPPCRWAAHVRPRTAAAATGYSGRPPRGLPTWESRGRRRACDSIGSVAWLIRIWQRRLYGPVFVGFRRRGSSLQPQVSGCRSDVGLASSGDSSPAVAPSALVLEGLAPDFTITSGNDIFNFAFVFHIDQET